MHHAFEFVNESAKVFHNKCKEWNQGIQTIERMWLKRKTIYNEVMKSTHFAHGFSPLEVSILFVNIQENHLWEFRRENVWKITAPASSIFYAHVSRFIIHINMEAILQAYKINWKIKQTISPYGSWFIDFGVRHKTKSHRYTNTHTLTKSNFVITDHLSKKKMDDKS